MGLTKEAKMQAEMRVKIAKDAITQVLAGTIIPIHGYYVTPKHGNACKACVAGALLVAHFGPLSYWIDALSEVAVHLSSYFSRDELEVMEKAFEEDWGRNQWQERDLSVLPDLPKKMRRSGFNEHAHVVMLMILHNIVRNNGTFIPADKRPVTARGPWESSS